MLAVLMVLNLTALTWRKCLFLCLLKDRKREFAHPTWKTLSWRGKAAIWFPSTAGAHNLKAHYRHYFLISFWDASKAGFFHLELSMFSWLLKWFIAWRWYFAPEKIIGKWRRAGTQWVVKQFQVLNLLFQALKVWSWLRQLRQNGFRPLFWAWLFNKNQNKSCKQWYSCLKYVGLISSLIILALSNMENI